MATKINAKIVADSRDIHGNRLTTYVLTYPRMIHAEVMTHRMFSRNAASSRAIPFKRMLEMVENDPFIPIAWQKDHRGMQGTEYLTEQYQIDLRKGQWLHAAKLAKESAIALSSDIVKHHSILVSEVLEETGITKQICNRLLEPFMWYTCLVTATEFENFFELRCPKYKIYSENMPMYFRSRKDLNKYVEAVGDTPFELTEEGWWMQSESGAEIHIQALAESMWDKYNESQPKELKAGEWHIPFGDKMNPEDIANVIGFKISDYDWYNKELWSKIQIATARCARLSYMTFDGEIDYEKDIALHDMLLESKHMSPFEHVAKCMSKEEYYDFVKGRNLKGYIGDPLEFSKEAYGWCNNLRGFIQYRYNLENEK